VKARRIKARQLTILNHLVNGLPTAARVIQVRDGKIEVKNGPHLSEGVAGYLIFEADNIEDATALAARIPAARFGGAVEVRPAEKFW
jgi:hypothetical protein